MGIIGLAIRILSLIGLYIISNPRKLKLSPPIDNGTDGNNPEKIQVKPKGSPVNIELH